MGDCIEFVQTCSQDLNPPQCVPTDNCNNDIDCRLFENFVDDGEDYICDTDNRKCVEKPDCESDMQCASDVGPGFICDGVTGDCRRGCRLDTDCELNQVCDLMTFTCVEGCLTDLDCDNINDTQECDEPTKQCVSTCRTIDDCDTNGQICDFLRSGEDTTPRVCQGCDEDVDCIESEFCDFSLIEEMVPGEIDRGLCTPKPPPCPVSDFYQENYVANQAFAIQSFPFIADGTVPEIEVPEICDTTFSPQGEWYSFSVEAGKVLDITIEYDQPGNLDISLRRSDESIIVEDVRSPVEDGGAIRITRGIDLGGDFLLQVRGNFPTSEDNPRKPYNLIIDVNDPAGCRDDSLEENDDATTARVVMPDTIFGEPSSPDGQLQVCGGAGVTDRDFYRLEVAANQVVEVRAGAPCRLGGVDIEVQQLAADGGFLPVSNEDTNAPVRCVDESTFLFTTREAGIYIVEVVIDDTELGNVDYQFSWRQNDNECGDVFEGGTGNNECNVATPLERVDFVDTPNAGTGKTDRVFSTSSPNNDSLALCTDRDYYCFTVLPLETIFVTTTYDATRAAGLMQLRLRGPDDCNNIVALDTRATLPNTTIVQNQLVGDDGNPGFEVGQAGEYCLAVTLEQGLSVPHDIEVRIEPGPPCPQDRFEPNDAPMNATPISRADLDAGLNNALTGLQFCDTSDDWYEITLEDNDVFRVDLRHQIVNGNIDMALFDANQVPLATSNTTTDNEELTYTVPAGGAGTYFLRLFSDRGARDQYRMLLYLNGNGPADPECPDQFENNDSCPNGTDLAPGAYNLLVCGQTPTGPDDDWFSTTVQPGETLDIELIYTPAQGKVNLTLVPPSCSGIIDTSQANTGTQQIMFTSQIEQTLNYRAWTTAAVNNSAYELNTTIIPAPPCPDDANEPNDTGATATAFDAPRTILSQFKCEDDDDWYVVSLLEGRQGEAYLNYDTSELDLSLDVFSDAAGTMPLGTTVGQGVVFTAPDDPTTSASDTQNEVTVWVRVSTGAERARVPYDLLLFEDEDGDSTLEGPADRACPDRFEDNDTRFGAGALSNMPELSVGCFDNLRACYRTINGASDDDHYRVFVPGDAELTVDATFQHDRGNIDLDIYDAVSLNVPIQPRGNLSTSMMNSEQVRASNQSTSGKDYVVRVSGSGPTPFNNDYQLCLSLNFLTPCPTSTENGDTQAMAVAQTPKSFENITLCENTEDWTSYTVGAGERVFFGMEQNTAFGDMDMELIDSSGTVVASATGVDNVDSIDTTVAAAGTYFLRIFPKDGLFIRNVYDLYVEIGATSPAEPYCPDAYERNDNFRSAAGLNFLADNQYSDMLACGADEDWYRVTLSANTTYEAKVFFDAEPGLNLDVEFLDDTGASLSTSNTTMSDEITTYRPTRTGTYYVGVKNTATNPVEGNYYFYFDRENTACIDDAFEPNDSRGTAKDLLTVPGLYEMRSCIDAAATKEEDYYVVTAANAGDLTITVLADDSDLGLFVEHFSFQTFIAPPANVSANRHTYTWSGVSPGDRFRFVVENSSGDGPYYVEIDN